MKERIKDGKKKWRNEGKKGTRNEGKKEEVKEKR